MTVKVPQIVTPLLQRMRRLKVAFGKFEGLIKALFLRTKKIITQI